MPEVSGRSIMMAVQAVSSEIQRIAGDGPASELDPDDQELLLSYDRCAAELKAAYLEARKTVVNLPPYEKLVQRV